MTGVRLALCQILWMAIAQSSSLTPGRVNLVLPGSRKVASFGWGTKGAAPWLQLGFAAVDQLGQ